MGNKIKTFLLLTILTIASANLEGPFLFFGPKSLTHYKRPALKYLGQDELMEIYGDQPGIVVFNNQDSVPLSSGYFPRLRKMVEGLNMVVLPQDYLEVHPDYVSNETQMLTLQGPWSERDAQMTETFERLQDIYGKGNVLGILGNSISQSLSDDYEDPWSRRRRRAADVLTTEATDDQKTSRGGVEYAFFNASGPPGKSALFYSSRWPVLRWPDGTVTTLNSPVGVPTVKPTRLYTILVVKFADGDGPNNRITLEFSYKQAVGWWTAVGVEVKRGLETSGFSLQAPASPDAPAAVLGKAYHCSLPLVYKSENASLTFVDVRMQVFMDSTDRFADAFDCIGFTTVPIWSGLMVTFIMCLGLAISICMIMDIKTMDRFETSRSKQLTITVVE